ncbi:MAG: hypothetical protein EOP93_05650 [Lysobacteraceae bacterium]|nr:MAG: hypothetical protein EOP93_05650 [Xanthomonadaceae bacterium]
MFPYPRHFVLAASACLVLAAAGCATTPASTLAVGSQATIDGTIASIDTKPWTYDGNAVVTLETAAHGRVSVQLPARWNLCKAAAVDVAALAVGRRAQAVGTVTGERGLVVCESAEHRLVALD